jgi:hypothetical protein
VGGKNLALKLKDSGMTDIAFVPAPRGVPSVRPNPLRLGVQDKPQGVKVMHRHLNKQGIVHRDIVRAPAPRAVETDDDRVEGTQQPVSKPPTHRSGQRAEAVILSDHVRQP